MAPLSPGVGTVADGETAAGGGAVNAEFGLRITYPNPDILCVGRRQE
jgi:hypothetical protein